MMTNAITQRLATTATGYAAIIGGVLDIRTVTDGRNAAALNALFANGTRVESNCTDRDCTCLVELLGRLHPDVQIVAVAVQVTA